MPENLDIDKLIDQEVKKDAYRREYNSRDDVKERRRAYNVKKREQAKIARDVMNGNIDRVEGERRLAALEGVSVPATASEPSEPTDDSEGSEES